MDPSWAAIKQTSKVGRDVSATNIQGGDKNAIFQMLYKNSQAFLKKEKTHI